MTALGVVLAAGAGDRFAGPHHKLRAEFRGRPLVSWAIDAARGASGLAEVVVITGAVDLSDVVPDDVAVIANPAWLSGQASSLQVAVAAARAGGHDALVVGLGDSPLVPSSAWDTIARADGDIVTATFHGERRPPTRLSAAVWPLLPTEGDEGARVLFRTWPERVREVACEGEPIDIDTLEDLAQWN
jgi:CTP:molybdopterin cytidylyltransferase MocA